MISFIKEGNQFLISQSDDRMAAVGTISKNESTSEWEFCPWDCNPTFTAKECEQIVRKLKTLNKGGIGKYCFIFDEDYTEDAREIGESSNYFCVTKTSYFDECGYIDDCHITYNLKEDGIILEDFCECQESLFETELSREEAEKYLKEMGLVERTFND